MANSLTRTGGSAVGQMLSPSNPHLVAAKMAGADKAGGLRYLRFSGNTGQFTVKDEIIPDKCLFAFDVMNVELQWLGWSNGKPSDRVRVHLLNDGLDALPAEHELPPVQKVKQMDGWKLTAVFRIRDMDGEFGELELTLPAELNRPYPRPAWQLINAFGAKAAQEADEDGIPYVPIVELTSESFDSQGGVKYAPVLEIVDWVSSAKLAKMQAAMEATDGDEIEDDDDEEVEMEPQPPRRRGGRV
jgi:hypothetical protein